MRRHYSGTDPRRKYNLHRTFSMTPELSEWIDHRQKKTGAKPSTIVQALVSYDKDRNVLKVALENLNK